MSPANQIFQGSALVEGQIKIWILDMGSMPVEDTHESSGSVQQSNH